MRHFIPPIVEAIRAAGGHVLEQVEQSASWTILSRMVAAGHVLALACRGNGQFMVVEVEDPHRHEAIRQAMATSIHGRVDFLAWYSIPNDAPHWTKPTIPNPEPTAAP